MASPLSREQLLVRVAHLEDQLRAARGAVAEELEAEQLERNADAIAAGYEVRGRAIARAAAQFRTELEHVDALGSPDAVDQAVIDFARASLEDLNASIREHLADSRDRPYPVGEKWDPGLCR